jgi:signal peptidase II
MRRFHFLISLGVILLDQFTKWLVNRSITLHDSVVLIPGFLKLTNAASLILFSVIAMCIVTMLLWRNSHQITMTGLALSLILGGAAGNLWDRMMHGHVVDFLDFFVGSYHWPAFNVADSAIVVGAFVLMGEILFAKPAPAEHAAAE